jgi:hypothetical protein
MPPGSGFVGMTRGDCTVGLELWRVAVLAVLVAAGGVAVAAIPDAGTGVFHGCYSTETGALLTG